MFMADMLVRLYDIPEVTPLLNRLGDEGVVIRTARACEKHLVVEWVKNRFGDGWAGECEVGFAHQPISCFIAIQGGKILGFACYDNTCKNFFGPTGVARENRCHGIGKALLLSCLYAMAANGYAYAIIGGTGPADYYAKTIGATTIAGSTPGIYGDKLTETRAENSSATTAEPLG
jgi:hypothetical protein